MKKARYLLKIEDPCQQDWDSMDATEGGRFCQHCSHAVIDFTSLSDSQVLALIEKSNGNLCGRFKETQLNRLMVQAEGVNKNPRLYKILAGLLLLASANTVMSQSVKGRLAFIPQSTKVDSNRQDHAEDPDNIPAPTGTSGNTVSGIVIDERTHKPVTNAHVYMKNSKLNLAVDAQGKFTIVFPHGVIPNQMKFEIIAPDHLPLEFVVDKAELPYTNKFVLMKEEPVLMGLVGPVNQH